LYELESTRQIDAATADLDVDDDGLDDTDDNCPNTPNAQQLDGDRDGFGDACDLCATIASTNHDEDADLHGDECDSCPAEPSFQVDLEGDGVGDACDNDFATQNLTLVFDPFTSLREDWEVTSGGWIVGNDTISATSQGATRRHRSALVDGPRTFWVRLGITSTSPWRVGDAFGYQLVTASGVVAGCVVRCMPSGSPDNPLCVISNDDPINPSTQGVTSEPFVTLAFNNAHPFRSACILPSGMTEHDAPFDFEDASLVLIGSPGIQFRFLVAYQ
jgi:hypothetical protein